MTLDYTTTVLMPSGAFITATKEDCWAWGDKYWHKVGFIYNGVEILYPDGTKRWISNNFYDNAVLPS